MRVRVCVWVGADVARDTRCTGVVVGGVVEWGLLVSAQVELQTELGMWGAVSMHDS